MYIINLFQQIIQNMLARKLRSFLALFGIVWGTLTVILLLAIGDGFCTASRENIMQISDGTFFAFLSKTSKSYYGTPKGYPINAKAKTIIDLQKNIPNIKAVSPILASSTNMSFENKMTNAKVDGVSGDFANLRKINLVSGSRFFSKIDVEHKNRVVIMGDKLKTRLFKDQNVVGKQVIINHVPFTIIGVVKKSSENVYNWYDNRAIIPYTTHIALFGDKNVFRFILLPNPDENPKSVENTLRNYFAWKYHFDPTDKTAVRLFDTTKIFQFFKWFFIGIQLFLGACGTLTLAVGALGVTNIMFLIVNERTREIGLRMAIGAKDWQILFQIILEALIIVGFGGLLGFLISFMTTEILYHIQLPNWLGKPVISLKASMVTISILTLLGLLAGYFPARRASNMDPVTALGFR